jgi:hypothetical protein
MVNPEAEPVSGSKPTGERKAPRNLNRRHEGTTAGGKWPWGPLEL